MFIELQFTDLESLPLKYALCSFLFPFIFSFKILCYFGATLSGTQGLLPALHSGIIPVRLVDQTWPAACKARVLLAVLSGPPLIY